MNKFPFLKAILLLIIAFCVDVLVQAEEDTSDSPTKSIAEIAIESGNFETLVAALTAADLIEVATGSSIFTVFAPTDDAFASLPDGLVTCLLKPDNKETLADILKYHVLAEKVMSTDLTDGMTATTLNGDDITVDLSNGVKIDESTVTNPDIEARNGVIHIIDSVLVPADIDVAAFLATCGTSDSTAPISLAPVTIVTTAPVSSPSLAPVTIVSTAPVSSPSDYTYVTKKEYKNSKKVDSKKAKKEEKKGVKKLSKKKGVKKLSKKSKKKSDYIKDKNKLVKKSKKTY